MLEKIKADRIYKAMLDDFLRTKRLLEKDDKHDGVYYGSVVLPDALVSEKIVSYLKKIAAEDNLNFCAYPVKSTENDMPLVLCSIDNEPEELKKARYEKIEEHIKTMCDDSNKSDDNNIIYLDDYRKKRNK